MTRGDMARACEDVGVGVVVEDVNAHLFAAAAELRKTCEWTQEMEDSDCWGTQCGRIWQFTEGGPRDNNAKFCLYCGGTLVEVPWTPEEEV